jgi:hypothetical protein
MIDLSPDGERIDTALGIKLAGRRATTVISGIAPDITVPR